MIYDEAIDLYVHLPGFTQAVLGFYTFLVRRRWTDASDARFMTVGDNYEELAARAGISRKTATAYIDTLVQYRLVSITALRFDDGREKHVFHVHDPLTVEEFRAQYPDIERLKAESIAKARRENEASKKRMRKYRARNRGEAVEEVQQERELTLIERMKADGLL